MNFTDPKQQLDELYEKHDKDGDGIYDEHEKKFKVNKTKTVIWHWTAKARKILAGEQWKSLKHIRKLITPALPKPIKAIADGVGNQLKTKTMIKSKNPKTTLTGIILIVAGLAQFVGLDSLSWDFASIINTALPLLTGAGLLAARDGSNETD